MSQATNVIPGGAGIGGLSTRTSINAALAAIVSGHVGTADPSYKVAGMGWWRSDIPGTGVWTYYFYDGTNKIALLTMDTASHTLSVAGVTVAPAWAGVRQTVAAGPVDTAGLPTFLPSTNAALSITTQNVSGTAPLVAAAANGWSATTGLPVDAVGYATANLTWSGLTASRAAATPNFLYGTIAGGVITTAKTILPPVYQWGGTPSTTSGQITFNISEMKAYLGNGSSAPQTNLVLFGEAATDGSGVISTVAYAYNGRYESGFTSTIPAAGTFTSKNHNIGVAPRLASVIFENMTTDNNFAVGDQIDATNIWTSGGSRPIVISRTAKVVALTTGGSSTAWNTIDKTGGGSVGLTLASWKYKFIADRGW